MKDKIFMTFLCATLCVVTNAMGAGGSLRFGVGAGNCKLQTQTRPDDAEQYDAGSFGNVWLDGDFLFTSDNGGLRCGALACGNGAEINISGGDYVFRCTVTGITGKWQKVELGVGVPFCDDSEIKVLGDENAIYTVPAKGDEKFYGIVFTIATEGFCVKSECKDGYQSVNGKCVKKVAESNAVTGGSGGQNAGISGNSANSGGSGASSGNSANGGGSGASNGNSANGGGSVSAASTVNNNNITMLGKFLDAETEKFERSKWRDAEGKFNTARLASDSIAAVVLGTTGGLISSKVIKKKQVENGFEDIKCTIGSQEVADWGDEFQVGIQ